MNIQTDYDKIFVTNPNSGFTTVTNIDGADGAVGVRPEYIYIANNITLSDEAYAGEHVDLVVYKGKRGAKICQIPYGSYAKIKCNDGVDLEWEETVDCTH